MQGVAAPPTFVDNAERRKSAGSNWNACSVTNYCNYDDSCFHDDNDEQTSKTRESAAIMLPTCTAEDWPTTMALQKREEEEEETPHPPPPPRRGGEGGGGRVRWRDAT